jgi:hypothetical protein
MKTKKNKLKITSSFTGTVDEFLNHCAKIEPAQTNSELEDAEKTASIKYLMDSGDMDEKQATEIYNELCLQEVTDVMEDLMSKGLVEITDYTEDGEPKFSLTDLGKKASAELKSTKK